MYKKIDMHVGPVIAQAKLVQKHVCSCRMPLVKTEIGTRYGIDLKSVRWVKFLCFGCGKEQPILVIDVWNELLVPQWFPLECLDVAAKIPCPPMPARWEKVEENMVSPAQRKPSELISL